MSVANQKGRRVSGSCKAKEKMSSVSNHTGTVGGKSEEFQVLGRVSGGGSPPQNQPQTHKHDEPVRPPAEPITHQQLRPAQSGSFTPR